MQTKESMTVQVVFAIYIYVCVPLGRIAIPATKRYVITYIGTELPDKAGEIVVFEVSGKNIHGEGLRVPHYETVVPSTPRNYVVCVRIIHKLIGLAQERRRPRLV